MVPLSVHDEAYSKYINSPAWKVKRQERLSIDRRRCQGCGSKTKLHVHHRDYSRFGGEELMDDLITVCESCHSLIHKAHRLSHASLSSVTDRMLKQMKPAAPLRKTELPLVMPEVAAQRRPGARKASNNRTRAVAKKAVRKWGKQVRKRAAGWERDSDPTWVKSVNPNLFKAPGEAERRRNGLA